MKVKTEIIEAETHNADGTVKKTKVGRVFARFLTSTGWVSCFDDKIIDTLKLLVGRNVVIDIQESKDGKFKNIAGIYPDGEQVEEDGFEDAVERTNAQEQQATGKPKDNKDFPKYNQKSMAVTKIGDTTKQKEASYYVAYAKDILVAYMNNIDPKELATMDMSITMAQAVQVVFNAKKIFS